MKLPVKKTSSKGFTLIESLVTAGILAILITALLVIVDPINQLHKLWDAKSKHDLEQIRNSLDKYYDDNNCYPTEIPFGKAWEENGVVYMAKVPFDSHPYCLDQNHCYPYYYQVDSEDTCPQWFVLYAHLYSKASEAEDEKKKNCSLHKGTVKGVDEEICDEPLSEYSYCMSSGNIDCGVINNDEYSGVSAASLTTTTIPTTTTQCACRCSDAVSYWGVSGNPIAGNCNLVPEGYCTTPGHRDCYCSTDCSGCACID